MARGWRGELKRYGAPAAFLAAVTIAVLLIKAGLNGGGTTTTQVPTSMPTTTTARGPRNAGVQGPTVASRYYTIRSGDTLGSVAQSEHTTVEELLRLNPGIDPTALHVGQRIRIG